MLELEISVDAGDGRGLQTHVVQQAGGELVIPALRPVKRRRRKETDPEGKATT